MRTIVACKEIEGLIELVEREEALNLTKDEIAFYDALETNDSVVKVIPCGQIARELVATSLFEGQFVRISVHICMYL
jgi:type I restriction enzyme R subunit